MAIMDLTMDFIGERFAPEIRKEEVFLQSGLTKYTGIVYTFRHDGMSGTYIDFPGHIAETDDGVTAGNFPVEEFYRIRADVVHLAKNTGEGAVYASDLISGLSSGKENTKGKALIINALGEKNPLDIESRSVYLSDDAVEWIIENDYRLLVSDIYESQALHGVFLKLFASRISTVCMPVNLGKLPEKQVLLTVLFAKMPHVTQLPCRIVAEY